MVLPSTRAWFPAVVPLCVVAQCFVRVPTGNSMTIQYDYSADLRRSRAEKGLRVLGGQH